MNKTLRYWLLFGTAATALALLLKLAFGFTIINTAVVISGWAFIGHIITIDDDFPGGWSNPAGDERFPWVELAVKAILFSGLLMLKYALVSGPTR